MTHPMAALLAQVTARSVRRYFLHLGAAGLIPLGILDSSLIPVPGSLDFATVFLAARYGQWFYYAAMATVGSVAGAYLTYRLARHRGKELLTRRFNARTVNRVNAMFHRSGFAAIAVPAMLPPPTPMVIFVLAAGAAEYPANRFLLALTVGRVVRYSILALLAEHYGRHILRFFSQHALVVGIVGTAVIALAIVVALRRRA